MTVDRLCAGYHGKAIIDNINLKTEEGKITTIVGPNGCGKSTLLKVMSGQLKPICGNVIIDGYNLNKFTETALAKLVSYMPQTRNIPEISVRLLVSYGRFPYLGFPKRMRKCDEEVVIRSMAQANVSELADRSLSELSGGERQMAYLAMLLAQDTKYLLLDEPTTYMDINHNLEFMELIKTLKNKTTVMILHDLNLAFRYSDKIAVMANGRIFGYGTAEQVTCAVEEVFKIRINRIGQSYEFRKL